MVSSQVGHLTACAQRMTGIKSPCHAPDHWTLVISYFLQWLGAALDQTVEETPSEPLLPLRCPLPSSSYAHHLVFHLQLSVKCWLPKNRVGKGKNSNFKFTVEETANTTSNKWWRLMSPGMSCSCPLLPDDMMGCDEKVMSPLQCCSPKPIPPV